MEILTKSAVSRKISKAKLAKNGGLEITFQEIKVILLNGKEHTRSPGYTALFEDMPHPDLFLALDMMCAHLAIIAWQLDGRKPELDIVESDEEFIKLFKVSGFAVGGSGESEGVTLIGSKKIKRGILNIPAPFTKFYDENNPYEFSDELAHIVMHATDEVNKYIDGKIAPDAQGKFDFDENSDLE